MIGDGELLTETTKAARGNVMLTHTEEASALMKAFDVLLLTSAYESFGYVLVEAAQAGVPAVSTPVGIAPDLLADSEAGFMAPETRRSADACVRLLTDDALRARCGEVARQRAASFTIERMAERDPSRLSESVRGCIGRAPDGPGPASSPPPNGAPEIRLAPPSSVATTRSAPDPLDNVAAILTLLHA